MAEQTQKLTFVIDAQNKANQAFKEVEGSLGSVQNRLKDLGPVFTKMAAIGTAAVIGLGVGMKSAIDASNELNNSLIGLTTVANAFGANADEAKQAAIDLAKDGLMSVKEASNSLKNLLASKFSLPEAIKLMNAFKDAAAFNRQGTLKFGEAIEGATQGIKNQNSIMVDNAGITKNLSVILTEAGYSAQDLQLVTTDAGVRMALFNGILKEAAAFSGDAARAAEQLSGKQAILGTQVFNLKAAIGDALAPALTLLIEKITPIVVKLTEWIRANPKLAANLLIAATAIAGLVAVLGSLGLALLAVVPAIKAVGVALLFIQANPVVLAVAAIIAAIYLLVTNWDKVKSALVAIWEGIKAAFRSLVDWFRKELETQQEWNKRWAASFSDVMKGQWAWIFEVIDAVKWLAGQVGKITQPIVSALGSAANWYQGQLENRVGGNVSPEQNFSPIPTSRGNNSFNFTFNGDVLDKNQFIQSIKNVFNRETTLKMTAGQ